MAKKLTSICLLVIVLVSVAIAQPDESAQCSAKFVETDDSQQAMGPTVHLDFDSAEAKGNSIWAFMYFVPSISPVPVDSISSTRNRQRARIISCSSQRKGNSFKAVCRFEMWGRGSHRNTFDSEYIIADETKRLKKGESLKTIVDYIDF